MNIRPLKIEDKDVVIELLNQLGYPGTVNFVSRKINLLIDDPNETLVVIENEETKVIGLISIHIIPQIAFEGDFARISYFVIDENHRNSGARKLMEEFCEKTTKEKNCDRIEVHCHSRREGAHRFYARQGYIESPKYFIKKL